MIEEAVEAAKKLMAKDDGHISKYMTYAHYVSQHRWIDLKLPRRTGKTTYLLQRSFKDSALMFVHNRSMLEYLRIDTSTHNIFTFDNMRERLIASTRGVRLSGMKYQCFLIDESRMLDCRGRADLMELIEWYHSRNLLTEDFYVLGLST